MAAVGDAFSALIADKYARTVRPVTIFITGTVDTPPVSPGVPTHPIMLPGMPGWGDPHPAHPIVLPGDPPVDPPVDPPTQPPSENWVWGYSPRLPGWTPVYVPAPGQPGPKT